MKNNKVIVDLFFKRGKYLLYLINERVKSGERREDIIRSIFAFCPFVGGRENSPKYNRSQTRECH